MPVAGIGRRRFEAWWLAVSASCWRGPAPTPRFMKRMFVLSSDRPGTNARRAVEFLASRGMLIPHPDRQVGTHERVLEQRIQALPAGLADELRRWTQVLRGEGRRPHAARSFETIRKYLGYAYPVLQHWSSEYDSLREITPQHVDSAMHGLIGHRAADLLTALRSIFRALKQERVIFRDPTRGFSVAAIVRLPASISTDRLRGLIDRADGPLAKLVVALIAIHARQARGHRTAAGRPRSGVRHADRPPPRRTSRRLSRRAHPPARAGLAARATSSLASYV